jgi:hypothetical protein
MVLTAIAIVLSIVGVAVFPGWRYSARWGYVPSAIAGLLLIAVAVASLGGKSNTADALAMRIGAGPQIAQAQAALAPATTAQAFP